ncbi:hypothetical protein BJ875DRAFT_88560 [Amylocarpus encephaloides]|uniref:Uncharacterized protein n=1 Tax=Amylocarpus encephaloides TaxID=45428 RepID=A0A9P7YR48_9HELO|nr:hypothetical protein BJ875DRAFT_88560 [Amylocarpus encephaloides]
MYVVCAIIPFPQGRHAPQLCKSSSVVGRGQASTHTPYSRGRASLFQDLQFGGFFPPFSKESSLSGLPLLLPFLLVSTTPPISARERPWDERLNTPSKSIRSHHWTHGRFKGKPHPGVVAFFRSPLDASCPRIGWNRDVLPARNTGLSTSSVQCTDSGGTTVLRMSLCQCQPRRNLNGRESQGKAGKGRKGRERQERQGKAGKAGKGRERQR